MKTSCNIHGFAPQLARILLILLAARFLTGCDPKGAPPSPTKNTALAPPAAPLAAATPALIPLTNMVRIKAGTYQRSRFPVTITHDFWLGKYEVTQAEFTAILGHNPSRFLGDSNRPVEKVSFLQASNYCAAISQRERAAGHLPPDYEYRLPTEAEWEYAGRSGTTNQFSFGDDLSVGDQSAWTAENSDATTHPVGLKRPNAWGLYDMHGNVGEWCSDWFEPYPAAPVSDPVGPATSKFKVFKGGGWDKDLQYARLSSRFMMAPSNGIHFVGFRLALGRLQPRPSP